MDFVNSIQFFCLIFFTPTAMMQEKRLAQYSVIRTIMDKFNLKKFILIKTSQNVDINVFPLKENQILRWFFFLFFKSVVNPECGSARVCCSITIPYVTCEQWIHRLTWAFSYRCWNAELLAYGCLLPMLS